MLSLYGPSFCEEEGTKGGRGLRKEREWERRIGGGEGWTLELEYGTFRFKSQQNSSNTILFL